MCTGVIVDLSPSDRERLQAIVDDRNTAQKNVLRARIVLGTADGLGTVEIMRTAGVSKTAVWRWQAPLHGGRRRGDSPRQDPPAWNSAFGTLPLSVSTPLASPTTLPSTPLTIKGEVASLVKAKATALALALTAQTAARAAADAATARDREAKAAALKTAIKVVVEVEAETTVMADFQQRAGDSLTKLNAIQTLPSQANNSLSQVQALTAASVLTIDYTADNQPVTFSKPVTSTPP